MRLEQELRENLDAAAEALVVPSPRRVPTSKPISGWPRSVAFAGAGAVAALALIVVPALLISTGSPVGTTLAPLGGTAADAQVTESSPAPTTTVLSAVPDPDEAILGEVSNEKFLFVAAGSRDGVDSDPLLATVTLRVLDIVGDQVDEVVVGEPGGFFWHPVSGPGGACQLSLLSNADGESVALQILLSPSLGCSEPYLFELGQGDGSLTPVDPSAEDVAWLFVEAWSSGAVPAMESLASPQAIEETAGIDLAAVQGSASCEGAAGSIYCSWETEGGHLVVRVADVGATPLVSEVRMEPNG